MDTASKLLSLFLLLGLSGCAASWSSGDDSDEPGDDDDDDDDDDGYPGDDDDDRYVFDPGEPPPDEVDDDCEDAPLEPVTLYVSADDSNSQAQPAWARFAILSGEDVGFASPREYEFLNYYDFDFGPGDAVRVVPQLRETSEGLSLLVAVVAPDRAPGARRPLNLTLSLDLSGSMDGLGIEAMQASLLAIVSELQAGDRVSAVQWSASSVVLLEDYDVVGPDDPTLLDLIASLEADGGTDLDGGLARAYEIAAANASPEALDRVVLISDGNANLGNTSAQLIASRAEDGESDGIYLAAIGAGFLFDPMLDTVTDLGRGSYLYVDSPEEADRKLRGEAFLATLDLAAREVQLALTLPEGLVVTRTSVEEISTDPQEVRPQHLAPNDAMLYRFELLDCGVGGDRLITAEVDWLEPFLGTPQSSVASATLDELLAAPSDQALKADAVVAYARALGTATEGDLSLVDEALLVLPDDPDLLEIRSILDRL